ncbi:MAG: Uma2 family endonuclease [Acidimicrobiales bacterium]
MRTLLPDPLPPELQEPLARLLEQRRRWGADTHDEVWEGVLHMAPAPRRRHANLQAQLLEALGPLARAGGLTAVGECNLGEPGDCRVPDASLHRPGPDALYDTTAALVVEVISPGDDTWKKLPFYAAHHVDEVLVVDPDTRGVTWMTLGAGGGYHQAPGSALVDVTAAGQAQRLRWPG